MNNLNHNLAKVQKTINRHAKKVQRNPEDITLVAVSKSQPLQKIEHFAQQGLTLFGENRVQELREKYNKTKDLALNWHFIGHLQRNKVKYLLRMKNCVMIESLDSFRLAKEIDKRANKNERIIPLLVEVNVSGDESKFGIAPQKTISFLKKVSGFEYIKIKGLMTLAPYVEDPEDARPYFQKLNFLFEKARQEGFALSELSMGMSNDYHIAIEEGATIIRVGSALFGPR